MAYTPENYTVYYGTDHSCSISGGDLENFNNSITTYTPNNQTLADFFFDKDLKFSIQIFGLVPSTQYCCCVVATNNHDSTKSEPVAFETKIDTTDTTDTTDKMEITDAYDGKK